MTKPKGRATSREARSQLAQLDSHPHGTEKGVKWPIAVKDGSREDSGPSADTGLKGTHHDPQLVELQRTLDADDNLRGYGLKARHANNTLQITGIVDNLEDKEHLKILLADAGIHQFTDGVSISTDGRVEDDQVALEVREELEADPRLEGLHISVESVAGTVFLAGDIEDRSQEDAAVAAARKARGVTRVVSQLRHLPGDMSLEAIFHSQVNNERGIRPWSE